MKGLCLAALVAAVAVGCAQPAAQKSEEIPALSDQWEAALNAGDAAAVAAMYAEDCRILPPNAEMATGRAAAEAAFGEIIAAGLGAELTTLESMVAGDLGFRVGHYTLSTAAGVIADRGKFIEIWRRAGGEWQITDDIWNSDLPAGPAGPRVIYTHEVADPELWLAAWQEGPESRHVLFAEHGAPSVGVFQSPGNPNLTGLLVEVTDMDALTAMIASPEGQAAAAADSVRFDTIQMLVEVD